MLFLRASMHDNGHKRISSKEMAKKMGIL
ncbi:MAG: hypothetical protein KGI06_02265 [Candidatus Micrarchaeota archaeon]|nr:hypothetical protein [Candidatus Micrarchaeota archaeon]